MQYPHTRRDDVVETLHGVKVTDPYRWLEDQEADDVAAWVRAQQAVTDAYLTGLPSRKRFRDDLTAIWDYPKAGVPWHRGPNWFQFRNTGLQEQSVLWTADGPTAEGRVLLDPNELSEDGTISLASVAVSKDGALLAYGLSDGGSDWITWRVRDVATGSDLDDVVEWSKFSGAAWVPDGSGFYYGAFDPPAPGEELAAENHFQKLRFHRLGTDAADDPVVYERPDDPDLGCAPQVTEDGRWLVVHVSRGTDPNNGLALARLDTAPEQVEVTDWLDAMDAEYGLVGNDGDRMLVQTDRDDPTGKVLAISATDADDVEELIPASAESLLFAHHVGGRLLIVRMHDAVHQVAIHRLDGTLADAVEMPELASVGGLSGRAEDADAYLSLSSFTSSPAIHRLEVATATLEEVRPAGVRVGDAITEQVKVVSTDGAEVPLFLIRPAEASPTADLPVILYGYGGFGIPLTPEFRLWWTAWLDAGGAIAVGCFRGGAEYGRAWHDAGRLAEKSHTFDDALACLRWLADSGWSAPSHLGITGGSNGGLTAAATMIRDPDAVGACVPEVGVLDLLRFHKFTIGWAWKSDYGDPDNPDDFARLLTLSPLHTLREGTCYPPTLVTTADRDDRVVPAHSFKFTAQLQHLQGCDNPVLARIDTRAGHGAGTPTSKLIDARADVLAFLAHHLGLEQPGLEED